MKKEEQSCSISTIAIIGAGLGGICLALALQRKGIHDYVIYEREEDLGGTWYQNAYPGCRCDVPAIFYSHSRFPNTWNESHPPRADILAYWKKIASSQNIVPHISHICIGIMGPHIKIIRYHPSSEKEVIHHRHQILISAIGGFHEPFWPDIKGLNDFEGKVVHTARWPSYLRQDELRGKEVLVLGNGCSGIQLVTTLAKDPEIEILHLARSAQWIIPNRDRSEHISRPYSPFQKRLLSLPPIRWMARTSTYIDMEIDWVVFLLCAKRLRRHAGKGFKKWMRNKAPEHRKEDIVPNFQASLLGYLAALNQTNVTSSLDEVGRVVGRKVITKKGEEHEVDYVVLATVFETSKGLDITGTSGYTLRNIPREDWNVYRGIAIPHFPNLFTMLGNNVATQHISALFGLEIQADYVAECLVAMREKEVDVIEPKEEAATAYNVWIDKWLDRTVWTSTPSYFRGEGGTGRIFGLWPCPGLVFWWTNRHPNWADYEDEDDFEHH